MIDFHTHILPGIDDGSPNIKTTSAMIYREAEIGVKHIVATPHFYAHRESVEAFLKKREGAIRKVRSFYEEEAEDLPKLSVGAEVYYFRGMGEAKLLPQLTVMGTNTLLLEMPFEQWERQQLDDVQGIMENMGLNIVLAHIERYVQFQKDMSIFNRIMELPLTAQINAGSFVDKSRFLRPDRKFAFCMEFIKSHKEYIIGSDCHNMDSRPPNLKRGLAVIEKTRGKRALEQIEKTTKDAIKGATDVSRGDY